MRSPLLLMVALAAAPTVRLAAQEPSTVTPFAAWRVRAESWDWFDAGDAGRYTFVGSHARAGLAGTHRGAEWRFEAAAPALLGLPDDAVLPAPAGQLGLGGAYFAANGGRRDVAGLFLKQASVRIGAASGRRGTALRAGRFEFADGAESVPRDPVLASLRAQRVAQRLLGTFGFTHGQRSFDGALVTRRGARGQLSLAALRPTAGVFDVDGSASLPVDLAYAAWDRESGAARAPVDQRLFVLHAEDRRGTVPVDSRPLAERAGAPRGVGVTTVGLHHLQRVGGGDRAGDVLLWAAWQFGRWGGLTHRAHAMAAEVAWRFTRLRARPAVRVGGVIGSGDDDPADGTHGTFFQVLPTPRAYARFPFHNLMNVEELFATLELRPHATVAVRAGAHALRLREGADLWYLGGGAFDRGSFGYAGRPALGARGLGRMLELSVEWRPAARIQLELFTAHASGGPVMARTYGARDGARLLYLETSVRR